jgi:hypothetical protein
VHERDVAIPLGIDSAVVADEIVGCLHYAAALGPAFLVSTGSTREAILTVDAVDPDTCFSVHVGPHVVVRDGGGLPDATILAGPSVELLEALSFRAPLPSTFPESGRWFMSGLAAAFDTVA